MEAGTPHQRVCLLLDLEISERCHTTMHSLFYFVLTVSFKELKVITRIVEEAMQIAFDILIALVSLFGAVALVLCNPEVVQGSHAVHINLRLCRAMKMESGKETEIPSTNREIIGMGITMSDKLTVQTDNIVVVSLLSGAGHWQRARLPTPLPFIQCTLVRCGRTRRGGVRGAEQRGGTRRGAGSTPTCRPSAGTLATLLQLILMHPFSLCSTSSMKPEGVTTESLYTAPLTRIVMQTLISIIWAWLVQGSIGQGLEMALLLPCGPLEQSLKKREMGQQQALAISLGGAVVTVTTTAKSQALAVCCATVIAKSTRGPFTKNRAGSAAFRAFVESPALFRAWAEDWVLRPDCDTVFRLPIKDSAHWDKRVNLFLYLSVSPTLGVVRHSWVTRRAADTVMGCVGERRILVASTNSEDWKWRLSVVDVGTGETTGDVNGGAAIASYGRDRVKCNRKWIVGFTDNKLNVWKVVRGAPAAKGVCIGGVQLRGTFEFSPLCDDVVVLLTVGQTGKPGVVTFIDLGASFKAQELVVASRVVCREHWPTGVMWLPDRNGGSLGILHHADSSYYLLSANQESAGTGKWTPFPPLRHVAPIGKSHAIVTAYHNTTQFSVHRVGHDISEPTLSVACTWVCPSQTSGLIASTKFCETKSELPSTDDSVAVTETECKISFAVHDGSTGFHIGDFTVPLLSGFSFEPRDR
ncbi:hypothetical protein Pelo_15882 [Pelomyxa schiedti]|nr:hypothetical protein Pelo_15882 [Pelomyxa schiedti]